MVSWPNKPRSCDKMKQGLTTRTNRIKTLEMEKQEMFNEMNRVG